MRASKCHHHLKRLSVALCAVVCLAAPLTSWAERGDNNKKTPTSTASSSGYCFTRQILGFTDLQHISSAASSGFDITLRSSKKQACVVHGGESLNTGQNWSQKPGAFIQAQDCLNVFKPGKVKYCTRVKTVALVKAVNELTKPQGEEEPVRQLAKKKSEEAAAKSVSGQVKLATTAKEVEAKTDGIVATQRALAELGLYSGKVDGIVGTATKTAINQWLKNEGKPQLTAVSQSAPKYVLDNGIDGTWSGDSAVRCKLAGSMIFHKVPLELVVSKRKVTEFTWFRKAKKAKAEFDSGGSLKFWGYFNRDVPADRFKFSGPLQWVAQGQSNKITLSNSGGSLCQINLTRTPPVQKIIPTESPTIVITQALVDEITVAAKAEKVRKVELAQVAAKKKAEEEAAQLLAKKKAEKEAAIQLAKKKAEDEAARQLAKKKAEEEAAIQLAKKQAEEKEAAKKAYASQLAGSRAEGVQTMISVQSELMRHPDYPDRLRVESALGLLMGSIAGDDLALIQSTQEQVLAEVALMVGYAQAVVLKLAKKKAEEEAAHQLAKKKAEEAAIQLAKKKAEEAAARLLAQKKAEEAAIQLAKKKAEEEAARLLAQKKAEEEAAKRAYAKQLAEARTQGLQTMISVQSELMRHPGYPDRSRVEGVLGVLTQSISGDDLALIQSTQEQLLAEVALMVSHAEAAARLLAKKKAEEAAARLLAQKKAEEEAAKKAYVGQLAEARTQGLQTMISVQSELMRHPGYPDRSRVEGALGQFTQSIAGDDLALIQSMQEQLLAEVALMVGYAEEAAATLAKKEAEEEAVKLAQAELKNKQEATSAVDKSLELEFWQAIKDSNDADMFQAYIDQFPKGVYATIAKLKIKKLGSGTSTVAKVSKPAKPSIPKLDYGDYYALVIGNNRYEHLQHLRTAVNDARNVADVLKADYGFDVTLLENADRAQIIDSISGLRGKVSSEDNVLIYYAGHGWLDEAADEGFWLPVDAKDSVENQSSWIATDRVVGQIRAMKAKHVMIVADSCFSGTLTRGLRIEERTPDWLKTIVKKKARTALTSGGLEPVSDSGGGENSIFAHSFLSILKDNDGVLDASKLFRQLKPKVMMNSEQTPEYGDIHKSGHDGGDFLFVRQ